MTNETPVDTDSLPSPGDGASKVPAAADTGTQQSAYRLVPAVVRGPFNPVAYVLIDKHLLLPAVWHDNAKPAPATGDIVTVRLPAGQPTPEMLPLAAYREQPESAPPTAVLSDVAAPEEAAPPEDASASEEASTEAEPEGAQPSESPEAS